MQFSEVKNKELNDITLGQSPRLDQTSTGDAICLEPSSRCFTSEDFSRQNSSCMASIEYTKSERLDNIHDKVNSILEENAELRKMNLNLKFHLYLLREREKRNHTNTRRLEKIIDKISSLLLDNKEVELNYSTKQRI
mmetsp:Transcript_5152/g.9790  ORF Transcript_5152/g.9790 Transcript_5152/m.9790 type:complete len:137 (-) Transcript_5152:2786-3196(-)